MSVLVVTWIVQLDSLRQKSGKIPYVFHLSLLIFHSRRWDNQVKPDEMKNRSKENEPQRRRRENQTDTSTSRFY